MPVRKANATWEGGLKTGHGGFKTENGVGAPFDFKTRFEGGGSNPEELLAAAHAGCFSMALSAGIEKAGKTAGKIETTAACTIEKVGEGFKVTKMQLTVRANVAGMDAATFEKVAQATKEGCPISGVMKGNVAIELDAKLA